MNFVQDICDDLHTLFEVSWNDICKIWLILLKTVIYFSDWQRLRPADVWKANECDEGSGKIIICLMNVNFFLFKILNLSQALKDGKSPLQLVQMPSVFVERWFFIPIYSLDQYVSLWNFRSRGHVGTSEKFRNLGNTFTQRFQKKAPFFSWCWRGSENYDWKQEDWLFGTDVKWV